MRQFYQTRCNDKLGKEINEGDILLIEGIVRDYKCMVDFQEGEFVVVYEDGDIESLKDNANRCAIIERTYPENERTRTY